MKNIVVCCDGTRGRYATPDKNTNVVRLFERLGKDGPAQVSYYDPGVGTQPALRGSWWVWVRNAFASASGSGLRVNIVEAFRYLMQVYEPGDRIFLFGYSRGAHTVRVLAGLLDRCGLLTKGSENLVPHAFNIYREKDREVAERFRDTFSRPCSPYFIGVFDTVASMGWLWWRKYFRDQKLGKNVRFGYQSLSVDEKRAHFRPAIWDEDDLPGGQVIEQVWFAGCHGDVGGQNADRRTSDIPLEWMIERAKEAGLEFGPDWRDSLSPDSSGEIKQSWKGGWWLTLPGKRPIPEGSKLHETVLRKVATSSNGYRPTNVPTSFGRGV